MRRRERVLCALEHEHPDRTPTDFQAVGEIWTRLFEHFHAVEPKDLLDGQQLAGRFMQP